MARHRADAGFGAKIMAGRLQLDSPVEQLQWQDARRSYVWRKAASAAWGYHVLEYPLCDAGSLSGQMLLLLPGQASALEAAQTDTVYLGVEGELEFTSGPERHVVGALDLLGIARQANYRFTNCGLSNALVFCMRSKKAEGEPSAAACIHMAWKDYRNEFRWDLPFADQWGFHRGAGPHMRLDGLSGHTVRHPVGQASPWHAAERDLLFIQLQGNSAFRAAGKVWELAPWDLLVIHARTPYSYFNAGTEESVFLDMGMRITQASTYYAEDPGWPVRADARVLKTEKDAHGQVRLV